MHTLILALIASLTGPSAVPEKVGPVSYAALHPTKAPERLNLLRVELEAGTIAGIDVAQETPFGRPGRAKTGNSRNYANLPPGHPDFDHPDALNWTARGFDGVEFVGKGEDLTFIAGKGSDASVMIGRGNPNGTGPGWVSPATGVVRFTSCTIVPSNSKAVFAGTNSANASDLVPLTFIGVDMRILALPPPTGGNAGRWGLFTNATDVLLRRVKGDGSGLGEHFAYAHGFGRDGITWEFCDIDGAFSELFKATNRPGIHGPDEKLGWYTNELDLNAARHVRSDGYQPVGSPEARPTILIRHCNFRRWGLGGYGGGAVTCQGTSANIQIRYCTFWQMTGHQRGLAIAIDNGGEEYFGTLPGRQGWAAGVGPANGDVDIELCLIVADPGPAWLTPMVSCIPISLTGMLNPDPVCESFSMRHCAVYGTNRVVAIRQTPVVQIAGVNSPAAANFARSQGVDTRTEPQLLTPDKPLRALSGGYALGAVPTSPR